MLALSDKTADGVWRQAFNALSAAAIQTQPSRAGETREILHVALAVDDPRQRWVLSRDPPLNPAFAIAEAICILSGCQEAPPLNFYNSALPLFSGNTPVYPGAYGYRLRHRFGVDQVRRACDSLLANPDSRQVVLQIWDAATDLPNEDGSPRNADIPCNLCSILKVRSGHLDWTQIMRSNDLHRGLPYNFVQFTILQEVLAGWLGLTLGVYHHWSDSLHAYIRDLGKFTLTNGLSVDLNNDSLAMSRDQGEPLVLELRQRIFDLTSPDLKSVDLQELAAMRSAPVGYRNLVTILAAESARRRGWYDLADEIASSCTNPQLSRAWTAWKMRVIRTTVGDRNGDA